MSEPTPSPTCDREGTVLVCGLGSLGQACLQRLLRFDVPLRCLDRDVPVWRDPLLEERFSADLVRGDMRLVPVLRAAGAARARAVLLLGSQSTANFEAALQVRLLNPTAQIVVRSTGQLASLGVLLEERLPGVAVVDPQLLAAGAVTEALRPGDQVACFQADGQSYVVLEGMCGDRRLQRPLRPGGDGRRPLLVTPMGLHSRGGSESLAGTATSMDQRPWRHSLAAVSRWLRQRNPLQRGIALTLLVLTAAGIALFSRSGGWKQGAFVTLALLKGEYVDPVNLLLDPGRGIAAAEPWLIVGSLLYALLGTLLTSALVALILEWLLQDRFGPARPRRLRRGSRQILVAEGGELGLQVASALQRERHHLVRIDARAEAPRPSRGMVVFDRLGPALAALAFCRVDAIGLLSPDLLANLQTALDLQRRWPGARLAILAHAVDAADRLGQLLGGVTVISSMDLAADAVVATAFGERVEEVCRVDGVNLLLVRYRIEGQDGLEGLSISRVENGYGITAVQITRQGRPAPLVFPSPDLVMGNGDQLLVLASLADLRRIEARRPDPPAWRVRLQGAPPASRRFDAQQVLARHLGGAPGAMAPLLDGREHVSPPLDEEIGALLVDELGRQGVRCRLEPIPGT